MSASWVSLLEWYGEQRPFRLDLVGDYAGSSRFLIHGDSLLRYCFSDPRIDFSPGFQLLHAVYVVEQFLQNLIRRKCVFDVVFLERDATICVPSGRGGAAKKWMCARAVVVRHLLGLRGYHGEVKEFVSVNEGAFLKWVTERRPLFIMTTDGNDIGVNTKTGEEEEEDEEEEGEECDDEDEDDEDEDEEEEEEEEEEEKEEEEEEEDKDSKREEEEETSPDEAKKWTIVATLYRLMHIGEGYNIALINRVEFVDSKIFTYIYENTLRAGGRRILGIDSLIEVEEKAPRLDPRFELPAVNETASTRERLTIYSLVRLLSPSCSPTLPLPVVGIASIYLLHTAFLKHLSLEERRWSLPLGPETSMAKKQKAEVEHFLNQLAECTSLLLTGGLPGLDFAQNTGDLCDFADGRLLLRLLMQGAGDVPENVYADFSRIASAVEEGLKVCGREITFSIPKAAFRGVEPPTKEESTEKLPTRSLLPFSNPIFDTHLESIRLAVDTLPVAEGSSDVNNGSVYREETHWHNSKKPLTYTLARTQKKPSVMVQNRAAGGKGQPDNNWERRAMGRARKFEQNFLNQMQRYAASLTDSVDGALHPKLIICDSGEDRKRKPAKENERKPTKEIERKPTKESANKKGGKPATKAPVSKAEKIKLENAEKSAVKEVKALTSGWRNICLAVQASRDEELSIFRLDEHLKKLRETVPKNAADNHEGRFIEVEVRLCKIQILQSMWAALAKEGQKQKGFAIVAVLFDEARKVLSSPALTVKIKGILTNVFAGLGIALPPSTTAPLPKRELSFKTTWNGTHNEDCKLGMTSAEFQLMYFGPYMDRNMDSKPDDRVPFEPDGWQRKVLDEIDSENSVFVVAPTSAGKTFISFHAMEKVLKASDEGILVYVAPTKALVNQIAAEVISRFRKNYRQTGKTVWAIHTRDYRMNDPNSCQILVTVPQILSIMLLSPTNAAKWSPRIKRIIFDEVHSIGNADDGVVWEQLLLLSPCPIIALSATVGNPEEFSDWLQSTQRSLGVHLEMIKHPYRYSDLSKYVYQPPADPFEDQPFQGLQKSVKFGQVDGAAGLEALHPVASLVDPTQGMPDDLALEPKDCLSLYRCMIDVKTDDFPVPDNLDYHRVFGESGTVIKKVDVIEWEVALKSILKEWMDDPRSPFQKLIRKLGSKKKPVRRPSKVGRKDSISSQGEDTRLKSSVLEYGTLPLLSVLNSENALPAILFSYDRKLCENHCLSLCSQLERGEAEWRDKDPRWKATVAKWEAWNKTNKSRASKPRTAVPTDGATKADMMMEQADREQSSIESFNPLNPSPEFSFADIRKCTEAEFEQEIRFLDATSPLVMAFKRGIGVHHAGMNRKYRQAVEMLFRKGYLKVVIATGTLALGINMPCKTVVFAGDSVYLTALNYRQAAGRAGRRGFDLIGNVVFHDIPLSKAQRLISSRLPSLMGHFPISSSLILRLFILLHNSRQSDHAKKCINSLLTQPRLVIGVGSFKEQMLHHLRFSIEFLRRQKLLGSDGTPLNFAGMTTHLYYAEASAFSLHALLCSGYFAALCKDINNPARQKDISLDLMLVMAHIFGRRPAPPSSRFPALPPLPKKAKNILMQYNKDTLQTYSAYVETFAKQYCNSSDNTLPFSKRQCGGVGSGLGSRTTNHPAALSSFVALSRHNKEFRDIDDLTTSVRSDIFLEGGAVPYLPVSDDEKLNNYLYSFYKDGDIVKLDRENGVRKQDVWFVLKDFSLVLATIVAGLECYLRDGPGAYFDTELIKAMDEDGEALGKDDGEVVEAVEGKESRRKRRKRSGKMEKVLKGFLMMRGQFEEKFQKIFA